MNIDTLARKFQTQTGRTFQAVLYARNGSVHAGRSHYWAVWAGSVDANGNAGANIPFKVRYVTGNIVEMPGAKIRVKQDYARQWVIVEADPRSLDAVGFDTKATNPASPRSQFVYLKNTVKLSVNSISTPTTASTRVQVREAPILYDNYGDLRIQSASHPTAGTTHPELSSYIPSSGNHRVAVVWLDSYDWTFHITVSTTQTTATALDTSDLQECFNDAPADAMPLGSFKLIGGRSDVREGDKFIDTRQFINMPQAIGFPSIVEHRMRVRENRRVLTYGRTTVQKRLEIYGELRITNAA